MKDYLDSQNIISIIPAVGWVAVYDSFELPLVCWALLLLPDPTGDCKIITGMDGGGDEVDFCEQSPNFKRYEYKG